MNTTSIPYSIALDSSVPNTPRWSVGQQDPDNNEWTLHSAGYSTESEAQAVADLFNDCIDTRSVAEHQLKRLCEEADHLVDVAVAEVSNLKSGPAVRALTQIDFAEGALRQLRETLTQIQAIRNLGVTL